MRQQLRKVAGKAGSLVKGRPPAQKLTAVGAAALLVTAPFGGLNEVSKEPRKVSAASALENGPFEITVEKALTAPQIEDIPRFSDPEPGTQFLILQLRVRNVSDRLEYAGLLPKLIRLPEARLAVHEGGGGVHGSPVVLHRPDASDFSNFNPDGDYRISIVYVQKAGWSAEETPVQLVGTEWVEEDPLTLDPKRWRVLSWESPVAEVEAPVQTLAEALAKKKEQDQ